MFNALSHTFRTIVRMVLPSIAAAAAVSAPAQATDCVTTSNHISAAGLSASGMSFTNYVNAAVDTTLSTGVAITVDATGFNAFQMSYLASQASFIGIGGISGAVDLSAANAELNLSQLLQRTCDLAVVTVNASSMSNAQIVVLDEFFSTIDVLSNLASDKTILVDAFEVSGQTVTGTGALTINSATLTGVSDLRNIASTINLTVPSPFSVSGASSSLAVRGNQLGSLSFNGGGLLTVDGAMGTHDLEARASGVTLAFANSSVTSGSTVTLSVVQAANKTIAGPGSVDINGTAVAANTNFAGIANAMIPVGLSVASGIDFTLTAAQANGLEVAGSGRVLLDGGAVGANASLTSLASTLDVGSTTGSFSVASGATFTLTAAQADGLTIAGAGTTNIAGNVAANANFTLISTLLNIPGVDAGATLTLTTAQGNGRTLSGAGSVALVNNENVDTVNFRGLTTAGFSFTGSVTLGNTVSINAVQAAGCAISGAGTVDILCTSTNDTVTAGAISARLVVTALAGNDTVTAGAGDDAIDGGEGADTANFSSSLASATFGAPAATLSLSSATDGSDSVIGFETLVFSGATVLVANTGGSEIASLNAALGLSASAKIYGNLEINAASFANDETASASYAALVARIVPGSVVTANAAGMNANQLGAVAGGSSAYVSISNLAITASEDATEIAALFAKAANGAVAVNAAGMDGDQKGALVAGIAKVSAISNLTIASSEINTEIATLATKASTFAVNAAGMNDTQKDAVVTAISQVSGIVSLALASSEDAGQIAALASKCADGSVAADAATMSDLQKDALVAADAKISSITNLALASTESNTDITTLLAKCGALSATADATLMNGDQKGAMAAESAIGKISSITNLALASSESDVEIAALVAKCADASVTADASTMIADQKGALVAAAAKLSSITNLALASSEDATEIASLLSKCAADSATANAVSMDGDQKGALATAIAKLSSITGLTLASSENAAEIAALASKCATGSVLVDASSMDGDQKGALALAIGKVSTISNLVVAASENVDELNALLGKTTGATAVATGMGVEQLNALAANSSSLAANGIGGTFVITNAYTPGNITTILGLTTNAVVNMEGMERPQTAAVNALLSKVATVNNSKVRVSRGTAVVHYDLFVDQAAGIAAAGDTMNVDAGTYALQSIIYVNGWSLIGAGSGATTLDMTAVPMSTVQGNIQQGINAQGSNVVLRGFKLMSTAAVGAATGAAYGIKTNPAGPSNPESNGLLIEDVLVQGTKKSGLDLNGAVNATVRNVAVDGIVAGYGIAISGNASGVTVDGFAATNMLQAWGEAAVFPYTSGVPSNVNFTGNLAISVITIQPASSTLAATVPAGNAYHNAAAQVTVPVAFNRAIGLPPANGSSTSLHMRQASVSTIQGLLVGGGVPLAAQNLSNTLGPVEVIRGGVAVSGKSVVDATLVGALTAGDTVQMNALTSGGTIALGATAFPATSSITGSFSITSTSFAGSVALDSVLAASGSATRSVVMTNMNATQVGAVALKVADITLGNIVDALYAVNAADAAGMANALTVVGALPNASYDALTAGRQSSTGTDMVSNRGAGYADVAAASGLFAKLVSFRTAQQAIVDGSALAAGDFSAESRYPSVAAAFAALPSGTALTGETSAVANSGAVITQFNALVAAGRGRTLVLESMNAATGSVGAKNSAFAGAIETAQAYDALDAGLTLSNDASNIAYLLGFSAANATNANATGMGIPQLNALAAGYTKLNSVNGTFTLTNGVTGIGNLLSRTASGAIVTVNMVGMSPAQIADVNANLAVIDVVTGAPISITRGANAAVVGYQLTIQTGIDYAAAGDVVNVAAGTYAEDLVIAKALSLRGPNYGINPNTGTRVAEAIIVPNSNNHGGPGASSGKLIQVLANDISVDGFTLDGDNPAISGGFAYGGIDSNCARALHNQDSAGTSIHVSGIDMSHNVVRNFTTTGYYLLKNGTLPNSSGNYVRNNLFQKMRFRAIFAQGEYDLVVTGNVMDQVHVGVAISSVGTAAATGFQPRISDNTINLTTFGGTSRHMGISLNHRFGTSVRMLVENNTVNADTTLVNAGEGIRITTMVFGGSTHATGNTVNCNGTLTTGLWLWNNDGQGETLVTGGSFSNAKTNGLYLTDYDAAYSANSYSTGNFGTVSGTSFSTIAGGTAVNVHWTGTGSNLGPCTLTMQGGATVGGLGTGIAMNGAKARVAFSGASPASLSSDLASYIALSNAGATNPATEIDATGVSFGGSTGATANLAANYDTEDKISHKLDDSSLGLVRVKASNVFVSSVGNIGRGVTAASTGDTVNVEAGSYTENITLDKRVALVGAGSGADGTVLSSSTTATPVVSVTGSGVDAANQLVIKDVRVSGAANASGSDGIAIFGDTPTAFVKVDGVHVTGHGQGVHYRSGMISNVSVLNSTFNANNFGVRVATQVTSMDGMTIDGCTMTEQTSSAITTNPSGSQTVVNTNFTVSNSTFANNSRAGVANQHDLSFFGFRGNATLSNVTVTSGNGISANSNSYGIVFSNASGSAALGTVSLSDVTVQGHVGKGALTFQYYSDISGVSLSGVNLRNCVAPWGDLVVHHSDTDAFDAGNTSLKTLGMWNAGGADATAANFYGSSSGTLLDRTVLADAFQIADQVSDAVDLTGLGYVNFRTGHVYVTPASFDARYNTAQGALQRAIAVASTGDVIHVKNGTEVYLTAAISKAVTFDGAFAVTASSFPNDGTANTVLSSFMSRLATGSTASVNMSGMNAAQIAAVNANLAGFSNFTGNPVAVVRGGNPVAYFTSIEPGITYAQDGDTVTIAAGTYAERLSIAKRITLDGAGKGSDPAVDTIITSINNSDANITVTAPASGTSATDRLVFKDLRLTGATGAGNAGSGARLRSDASLLKHVTFDNVAAVGNAGYGIVLEGNQDVAATPGTGVLQDIVITGCEFSTNNIGVRVASSANNLDGLTISNSTFTANTNFGFQVNANDYDSNNTNFVISGTTFNGNGTGGYTTSSRLGDVSILGFNGNLAMTDVTVNGITGDAPANLGISISGYGSASVAPVNAGTMTFTNVAINGKFAHPNGGSINPGGQGRAFGIKSYAAVSNVSFSNVAINNTYGNSLELYGITGTMNLAGIAFGVPTSVVSSGGTDPSALPAGSNHGTRAAYSIVTGMGTNLATGTSPVNASGATFAGLDTTANAGRFSAQARILDAIEGTDRGLVTLLANNVYVAAGSTIANGITAASEGDTVNVDVGTFNERVTMSKRLTLAGAGATTIVNGEITGTTGPAITVSASGASATDRLVIRDMTVTGGRGGSNTGAGIYVSGSGAISNLTFQGLIVDANQGFGIAFNNVFPTSDVKILNSTVSNSASTAIRIASATPSFTDLLVEGCTISNNATFGFTSNDSQTNSNVNTRFTFKDTVFSGNNTAGGANNHVVFLGAFSGDAAFTNVDITANTRAHGIVINGSGSASDLSTWPAAGNIVMNDVVFNGTIDKTCLYMYRYSTLANVSMTDVDMSNVTTLAAWHQLSADSNGVLDAGNTKLRKISTGGCAIDATDVVFYNADGVVNKSDLANLFRIEDDIRHKLDESFRNFVTVVPNAVYLSKNSGTLENAIAAASNGSTIFVEDGAPFTLVNEITKSVTFSGNFLLTSASFPSDDTATAVLSSFTSRLAAGSTIAVNAAGMNAFQLAAVAAAVPGNVSSVSITSAQSASEITSILAQAQPASATIDMTGMNPAQIAASNVGYAAGKTSAVTGWTIRVMAGTVVNSYDLYLDKRTGSDLPGSVERANTLKAANPSINYTVEMLAGTFMLDGRIEANRVALVGAGMGALVANSDPLLPPVVTGGTIIDMSNSPVDGTYYPQGILALGDGVRLEGFSLVSPTRSAGKGDRYGIKSAGPQTDSNLTTRNLIVSSVRVHDVKMSAFDLNTLVGGTFTNVFASNASAGYGIAFSGASLDTALSGITIANCAWGDVGVFPWPATTLNTPSGIAFSGELNFKTINCQPYTSTISVSSGVDGDSGYNASANVLVPAAFNRAVSTTRTRVSNSSTLFMNLVTRQADAASVASSFVSDATWSYSTPVTANILGDFEVVSANVALAGRSTLDAAIGVAVNTNSINVWTGSAVSLGAVITKDITITGSVPVTDASFASVDILNSLVSKVATSANLSVDLTSMADAKLNGVNALKASFDSIAGQLAAVNNAGTPGIISALNLSDVSLTAYNALPEVTGYLYRTAVATDMTANTREFADINAATILWDKYIGFRNAAYAALTGAPLTADDFAPGARYPTVATAYAALPVGTTLSGEASTVANSATVVTQFNALVLGGRGRTNSLNAMNTNDASISAMNTAFAAALETSQAYDKLDAGITVANSATEITYLFGFSAVNATSVNASGMIPAQLTSVSTGIGYVSAITGLSLTNAQSDGEIGNLLSKTTGAVAIATDMNSAKLSALGVGAGSIAADGITGTLAIDVNVLSLDALLGKTAVAATVNVNATGFDAVAKGVLSGKISKVDAIANLALASTEEPTEITNLLSVATAAVVNATGMDYTQFNALGASAAIANVAADGISGTFTITKDVTVIGAILGKTQIAATVTVNATGMSQPQLAEVSANITKVDTLSDVSVTSALTVEELSSLMSNPSTTNVFADATGMGADKLNVLAQYSSKLAANGVTGSVIVTSSVTDTDLSAFLAKVDAGATVEVNAAGMSATALSAAASNSTKIDSLYNLTLASAQSASEITTLLGLSVASAAEGKAMALATATDMDAAKLSALGGSYLKLAANGITGNVLLVSAITDTNITNLFSNIALAANVRVNGSGMGSTTLAILLTNIAKVDSAFNLALSNAQTAAELATLLGKSDVSSASADATNMDSNVGGDLATLADNYTKLASAGVSGSIVINSNLTSVQIANLLSKVSYAVSFVGGTTVVIDAQGMTDAQLTSVAAAVVASGDATTQASVFDVNNLTLSGAQQASEIAALLNVTAPNEATVVATGMTQEQLAEVGDYPSSVNEITGTIEITSDLTAAQIQAIMGNASTSANVTIDPNGFDAAQQAALYSNALLLVTTEATPGEELTGETIVKQGDTFVVVVEASGLTIDAVGVQARLNYDSSRVQFVDVLPTAAFETVIYGTAGSSGSQSYVTFATGIDVFDDSSTGIKNGDVARIRFVATAAFCNATDVVSLATSGFSNKFVASSTNPAPIPAVGTNLIDVSSLNNLAFASTWSANESLPADAGTTAGAFKANPGVTASNNCYTSVPVTFTITYPNASTGTTWPARFPVGTSTVVWRSEDLGGNIITLTRTVEVFNYQLMTMAPRYFIAAGAYTAGNRTITVRLSEDGLASVEQAQLFAFNANGQATSVDVQVPVKASYSCVSVKDDQRSLARAASSISVVGTKYDVAFATGGDGAMKLGDSNADNLVDILDFGVYIANRFPGYGAGSDYNNNLSVNNQDFAIFATNFLQAGDTCAGGFLAGQTPRDRVSVRELRRRGMGELIAADINGDGWVDVTDIQLAMQN